MVGVFFAVMIAVEAFFVVRAVQTFPGEDAKNSYVLGLDYNDTLVRREEQRRLGWTAEAGIEDGSLLVVRMKDSASAPLRGLDVQSTVRRIGKADGVEMVELAERSAGEYVGALQLTGPGRLSFAIEARRAGEVPAAFSASKTLVIR
jgi:nitrogen fixation protein FixH